MPNPQGFAQSHIEVQFLRLAHIIHTIVHHFLGQMLIRQRWEASLHDVGLSKSVRVTPKPKADNSFLE